MGWIWKKWAADINIVVVVGGLYSINTIQNLNPKMGKLSILYALFLIITLNTSTNTIKEVKGDAEFIKKTCKNTKYFNLCISSLKSDPTSSVSDLKGLASIMINIGMANASET